jgi:hypothetical protein
MLFSITLISSLPLSSIIHAFIFDTYEIFIFLSILLYQPMCLYINEFSSIIYELDRLSKKMMEQTSMRNSFYIRIFYFIFYLFSFLLL